MSRATLAGILLAAVATSLSAGSLAAQGPPPARVTLLPPGVVFPTPSEPEFDAGWVDHPGMVITVEPRNPNRPDWQLFIRATAPDMGGYGKPVSDILYRPEGSSAWTPLSTSPQILAEGFQAGTVTVYFRLRLDWLLDAPGSYDVPLEITSSTS